MRIINSIAILLRTSQSRDRFFRSVYLQLHSFYKSDILTYNSYINCHQYDIFVVNITLFPNTKFLHIFNVRNGVF